MLYLQKLTGPYVFILFMFVCIGITVYLAIVLPETKNTTFQQISNMFARRWVRWNSYFAQDSEL